MSDKYAAFGVELDAGIQQVETAVIVGTITGSGNATVTTTSSGMAGSPLVTSVAVLVNDTADTVTTKMAAALNLVAVITARFKVVAEGSNLIYTRLVAVANDATLNIAYTNDTCTGLTPDNISNDTTAGVAAVEIAAVTNVSGPGLAVDTEDVTSHDQATVWEEVVATIVRSGEVSLDIVYDPAAATHYATEGGVIYKLQNRQYTWFDLIFVSTYNWSFSGYVTGFEPGAPVEGALTASVTIKITNAPILE